MERPGKEGFFAPLTLTEQVILGIAALFSCGAMVFLFRMYLLYENLIDGTSSDDIDRASAAGSIMQGFAGTILAFASSLLFFVALIMQLREHRQAVDEMRKTTANHGQALQIAREEKEFNVCQAAVLAIVDETKRFKVVLDHTQGFDNIYSTTRSWVAVLRLDEVVRHPSAMLKTPTPRLEDIFPGYESLMALNVRVQWLKRAIKSKELDAVDREYLSSHLAPVITELSKKQTPLANALNCLNELIAFRTLQLGHLQLSEEGLNFLKQKLERIKEVSTYRIED